LDIGTTKIGVIIAEAGPTGDLKIVGVGSSPSDGLRKGVVVNIDKTVKSIQKAVEEAELMAGVDVGAVYVGIAGDHIKSINSRGVIAVSRSDNEITRHDVDRVIEAARAVAIPLDREMLHVLPQDFVVDEQPGIKDPVGMSGVRLEGDVHIVTAAVTSVQNLQKSVEKAGLRAAGIVLEPLASAFAVLDPDERELGCAVIDIGGGTTDVIVFVEDSVRHTASIGLGGRNVTNDLAIGIRTPLEKAEEIKRAFGTCLRGGAGDNEYIPVPGVGGREDREVSRAVLASIIEPRMREIFTLALRELQKNRHLDTLGAGIILTGGSSMLHGAAELAEQVFGMPVKVAAPKGFGGLTEAASTPVHATGVGLVRYGMLRRAEGKDDDSTAGKGRLVDAWRRVLEWLKRYV
jgi:cell division protein FtsA